MTCKCNACKQVQIGCATGIDCDCFNCTRPNSATLDLDISYNCLAEVYTSNCNGNGGRYCVQNCDPQSLYDSLYNGTIILQKYNGETTAELGFTAPAFGEYCGDFGYYFYHIYPLMQAGTSSFSPSLLITAHTTLLQITYLPLENIPCGNNLPWCQNPISVTHSYVRNAGIPCESESVEYRLRRAGYCISLPRTITLNLLDI